jgi:S1-C subfamily serine protease
MDLLDFVIVVVIVTAVGGGYRLGFLARAVSWLGLAAGLVIGARLLPVVVNHAQGADPTSRFLIATMVLLGGAFLGQALGLVVGARLHTFIPIGPFRVADRLVGGLIGLLGVLVAVWVLLPSMAGVAGWPSRQARNSSIARWIDQTFPAPPDTLQALRRLVGNSTFPQVFSALQPAIDTGPAPVDSGLPAAVQRNVAASTVKVEGQACRRIQEGSGFAVAADTILTNAHVVAGERRGTQVLLPSGRTLAATVVAFDPNRDLALLHVPGLGQSPLQLSAAPSEASVGRRGAVFGHPGGQDPLRIAPALLRQDVSALGRDLYDSHDTTRDVFILASNLMPGDSGGALVDQTGAVLGVAFAIAPDRPGTSYALTAKEIRAVLPLAGSAAASTGGCLTDG